MSVRLSRLLALMRMGDEAAWNRLVRLGKSYESPAEVQEMQTILHTENTRSATEKTLRVPPFEKHPVLWPSPYLKVDGARTAMISGRGYIIVNRHLDNIRTATLDVVEHSARAPRITFART